MLRLLQIKKLLLKIFINSDFLENQRAGGKYGKNLSFDKRNM